MQLFSWVDFLRNWHRQICERYPTMKCMSDQSNDLTRHPLSDDQRDHLERRALERSRRRLSGEKIPDSLDTSEGAYVGDFGTKVDQSSLTTPLTSVEISEFRRTKNERKEDSLSGGDRQTRIICPHCQERGSVHTYEHRIEEGGPSTWSVFASPFTYGLSLLWGWKSTKYGTFASCDKCGVSWQIS